MLRAPTIFDFCCLERLVLAAHGVGELRGWRVDGVWKLVHLEKGMASGLLKSSSWLELMLTLQE